MQNNQAGVIRRGQIREFLLPSSRCSSVSNDLLVTGITESPLADVYGSSSTTAFISSSSPPDEFLPFVKHEMIYLHAHEHARCILNVMLNPLVTAGTIVLSDVQLANCKVIPGEKERWTVYQGDNFTFDAREGAIGDTELRSRGNGIPILSEMTICIRRRSPLCDAESFIGDKEVDARDFIREANRQLHLHVVSLDEIFAAVVEGNEYVCRIAEVVAESSSIDSEEAVDNNDSSDSCDYRGLVDANTVSFL